MTRKTGFKYMNPSCNVCGEVHVNYSGKLDANDREYVVCGTFHKPITISYLNTKLERVYTTELGWIKENTTV